MLNEFLTWDGTASSVGMVNADAVNVRAQPVRDGDIVGAANSGDSVLIWCRYGDWYLCLIGDVTGWIFAEYVSAGV